MLCVCLDIVLDAMSFFSLSKEDLFPKLSHLSVQVHDEVAAKVKLQKHMIEAKSKMAVNLLNAKCIINGLDGILKYGRRGKPHETKLFYDDNHPCLLYWQSKQGEKSSSFVLLHAVLRVETGLTTAVFKKAAKKHHHPKHHHFSSSSSSLSSSSSKSRHSATSSINPEACLSLVTEERTLDLELKNTLQRDWLLKALRDVVEYAVEVRKSRRTREQYNITQSNQERHDHLHVRLRRK
jgi:hypothetical protein